MSTPPQPDFPPPLPPEPPKLAKNRTNAIIIGSAAAVIAAIVATGIVVVQSNDDSNGPATTTASSAADDTVTAAAEEESEPEPTFTEPTVDDFTMELRTTRRQCFGSAGCNLTVEPELTYEGVSTDLDPDATYEITYEIRGDEDGPVIETAELSNQTTLNFTPSVISGVPASVKPSVKITDVVTQPY
ncbi:hypothetical protein [Streptomyces sp. NPDC003877]